MTHAPARPATPRWLDRLGWALVALPAVGIAVASVPPYLTGNLDANRIPLDPEIPWHFLSVATHAVPASLALLIGPFQLAAVLRRRWPGLHRTLGRVYLASVLVAALTSVAAALASTSGLAAQLGFLLLAAAWLYTGGQGYRMARAGRIDLHRIWMIRNYALTFAAVLLRMFLFVGLLYRDRMDPATSLAFADIYTSSVWCSIFVSYVVAEWFVVGTDGRKTVRSTREPAKAARG